MFSMDFAFDETANNLLWPNQLDIPSGSGNNNYSSYLSTASISPSELLERMPTAYSTIAWKRGRLLGHWSQRFLQLKGNVLSLHKVDRQGHPCQNSYKTVTLRDYQARLAPHIRCRHGAVIELTHSTCRSYTICVPISDIISPVQWVAVLNARSAASVSVTEDFRIIRSIGKGGYGEVFLTEYLPSHQAMALKVIPKQPPPANSGEAADHKLAMIEYEHERKEREARHVRRVIDERLSHAYLPHPNIVRLFHCFQDAENFYLAMEFCAGGELFALSRDQLNCRFPEAVVKVWVAQLVLALEKMHNMGFVHRDIKPENLLLDTKGNVKLADFGFAKKLIRLPNGKLSRTQTFCGTKSYMSPEMLSHSRDHGVPIDFWSLGVLLYELLTGFPPFRGRTRVEVYNNILNSPVTFPNVTPAITASDEAKSLIIELLKKEPSSRIGVRSWVPPANAPFGSRYASEIRAHPFFADIDWDQLAVGHVKVPIDLLSKFNPVDTVELLKQQETTDVAITINNNNNNNKSTKILDVLPLHLHGFSFNFDTEFKTTLIDEDVIMTDGHVSPVLIAASSTDSSSSMDSSSSSISSISPSASPAPSDVKSLASSTSSASSPAAVTHHLPSHGSSSTLSVMMDSSDVSSHTSDSLSETDDRKVTAPAEEDASRTRTHQQSFKFSPLAPADSELTLASLVRHISEPRRDHHNHHLLPNALLPVIGRAFSEHGLSYHGVNSAQQTLVIA